MANCAHDERMPDAIKRENLQSQANELHWLSKVDGRAEMIAENWRWHRNVSSHREWNEALYLITHDYLRKVALRYLNRLPDCELSIFPKQSATSLQPRDLAPPSPPPIYTQLDNGLRVILKQDDSVGLLHMNLAFGAGVAAEDASNNGINRLMAQLMPKGTHQMSGSQIALALENRGASLSSTAGNNVLTFAARCLPHDASLIMQLLADITLHPHFDPSQLGIQRASLTNQLLEDQHDPLTCGIRHLREACFGASGYGLSPSGSISSLKAISREALLKHHAMICTARNAVLTLVGPFDAKLVRDHINESFGPMPMGAPVRRASSPTFTSGQGSLAMHKEQAVILRAMPALAAGDPLAPAFDLICEWMSDLSGPLMHDIREDRGLAYDAGFTGITGAGCAGLAYLYLLCAPEMIDETHQVLDDCLHRVVTHGMPRQDFENIRQTMISKTISQHEEADSLAEMLSIDCLLGLPEGQVFHQIQAIEALEHRDVELLIKRLFDRDTPHQTLIVGSP